jgi:D-alanyl-D-alanine carboxypeptidase/D-alanyl-D-alanine-endopeptidase (penicillin-binding protein 4)
MKQILVGIFFFLLQHAFGQNLLQTAIHTWVADQELREAGVGIAVIDTESRQLVASWNPNSLFSPASSLKILTTSSALIALGADYRFPTELQYNGHIDAQGVLHGNLYIKGYGDPVLGSDQMPEAGDLDAVLEAFSQAIQQAGIRKIEGSVVGDASHFTGPPIPDSWSEQDAGNYYGAGSWALNIHENLYYLPFKQNPRQGGKPTLLDPYPAVPNLTFINEVSSGPKGSGDNAYIYGSPYDFSCPVRGTIPMGSGRFTIKGAVPNPPLLAAQLLTRTLLARGVAVSRPAASLEAQEEGKRTLLYTHYSPPLRKIVERANQESVNLYCEALLMAIGKKKLGEGSRVAGLQAIRQIWAERGLSFDEATLADGSGLATLNRLSSYQLAQLIRKIYADPQLWPVFGPSLPVAGQTGTLADMLKGTAAEGRVQAKSGSMRSVRSYTGIVQTQSGRSLAFCMVANRFSCSSYAMRKKMEQLLLRIVQE